MSGGPSNCIGFCMDCANAGLVFDVVAVLKPSGGPVVSLREYTPVAREYCADPQSVTSSPVSPDSCSLHEYFVSAWSHYNAPAIREYLALSSLVLSFLSS